MSHIPTLYGYHQPINLHGLRGNHLGYDERKREQYMTMTQENMTWPNMVWVRKACHIFSKKVGT